jgi:preprotein translocase subunit SecE
MNLAIYKPGQGKIARGSMGVLAGALDAYGAYALSGTLRDLPFGNWKMGSQTVSLEQIMPLAVFIIVAAAIGWLVLVWPKFVDFLIETEAEMGRVVWPTRRTVIGSSVVVIVTVVAMSAILYGVDTLLYAVFKAAGLY